MFWSSHRLIEATSDVGRIAVRYQRTALPLPQTDCRKPASLEATPEHVKCAECARKTEQERLKCIRVDDLNAEEREYEGY